MKKITLTGLVILMFAASGFLSSCKKETLQQKEDKLPPQANNSRDSVIDGQVKADSGKVKHPIIKTNSVDGTNSGLN